MHYWPYGRWDDHELSVGQLLVIAAPGQHRVEIGAWDRFRVRIPGGPTPQMPRSACHARVWSTGSPYSFTMSSADSSPGAYFGSLAAGKIADNEMPPTIKNVARIARSRASSLIATISSTCSAVAEVVPSSLLSSTLVTKSTSPNETSAPSLGGSSDRPNAKERNTPNSPTATTLANAAPSAFETLFATPRNAPTSPASRLGDADTSTRGIGLRR